MFESAFLAASLVILSAFLLPFCEPEEIDASELRHRQRRSIAMTQAEQQSIVDIHNKYRSDEKTAANMKKMKWNADLAKMAGKWSDACVFGHGQPSQPPMPIGQNLFASSGGGSVDFPGALASFYAEKGAYDYAANTCKAGSMKCLHYTQVVWADSTDVGCAVSVCTPLKNTTFPGSALYYVCNYEPAGNVNKNRPYISGAPCSQCPPGKSCSGGLCN